MGDIHLSVGDFLLGLLLALVAIPIWKGLEKIWVSGIDLIAGSFVKLRTRQIAKLESELRELKSGLDNEHRIVLRSIYYLGNSLFLTMLSIVIMILVTSEQTEIILTYLMSSLKIATPSWIHWTGEIPFIEYLGYDAREIYSIMVLFFGSFGMLAITRSLFILRKTKMLLNPEAAIAIFETRIAALKSKSS